VNNFRRAAAFLASGAMKERPTFFKENAKLKIKNAKSRFAESLS
jgi:hypothetical protein